MRHTILLDSARNSRFDLEVVMKVAMKPSLNKTGKVFGGKGLSARTMVVIGLTLLICLIPTAMWLVVRVIGKADTEFKFQAHDPAGQNS